MLIVLCACQRHYLDCRQSNKWLTLSSVDGDLTIDGESLTSTYEGEIRCFLCQCSLPTEPADAAHVFGRALGGVDVEHSSPKCCN